MTTSSKQDKCRVCLKPVDPQFKMYCGYKCSVYDYRYGRTRTQSLNGFETVKSMKVKFSEESKRALAVDRILKKTAV